MASNGSSSLSRPWVLATTGFVAAYGTYLAWSNWPSPDPSANLQRRSTVRSQGRNTTRGTTKLWATAPEPSCPFGILHIDRDSIVIRYPISTVPHTVPELQEALNISNSTAYRIAVEAEGCALNKILQVLILPQNELSAEQVEATRDLQALVTPLRRRDVDALLAKIHVLCSGRWGYDQTAVAKAFANHCGLDRVPMPPDHADLGLTDTSIDSDHENEREPTQGIKGLIYNIAEESAKREAYIHRGIRCEQCGEYPIRGVRWHCINCPDFDLCSACEAHNLHPKTHVFAKVKIPLSTLAQPHQVLDVWYPGDPHRHWSPMKASVRTHLAAESGFEESHIEALYDQFTCTANVPLPNDPLKINAAIDRRAFNKAMMSTQWKHPLEPNFLYDRMFSFYDTDNNMLIDFEEYVFGIAYLRKLAEQDSLERIFQGYDVDGDGYISRRDFIRMLSAKYAVQKNIVQDVIEAQELEMVHHTAETVRSSQPISAAFAQEDVPLGRARTPGMKFLDRFGENQVQPGVGQYANAILPNGVELPDSDLVRAVANRYDVEFWPPEINHKDEMPTEVLLNVGNRLTQSESVAVDGSEKGEEQRFMVETDSRHTRGRSDLDSPQERWRQDVQDAVQDESQDNISTTEASPEQDFGLPAHILERGRAYEVPAAEKDFGKEVIFQVVQEGLNELIDPIFHEKEELAHSVRETREERRRLRKEINDYVQDKKAFQEELKTGSEVDPLLAIANAANHEDGREDERQRESLGPIPSQREIAQELREQIAQQGEALDEESLEDMEMAIRSRPLDDLLAEAGFSIAGPDESDRGRLSTQYDSTAAPQISEPVRTGDTPSTTTPPPNGANGIRPSPSQAPNAPATSTRSDYHSPPSPTELPMQTPFSTPSMMSSYEIPPLPPPHRSPVREQPKTPSKIRLEELSRLDEEEKSILVRGGPGRLDYKEFEKIIRDDRNGLLRGIVESWLEWAEF